MSAIEGNKAVIVRIHEALNRHDLAALDEHPGMAGTKAFLERYFRACPDARNTIEELVAEGAWVDRRPCPASSMRLTRHGGSFGSRPKRKR